MPPIYQPEVAADAIWYASTVHRREVWVGRSTVVGLIVNKLFPGVADRYLARKGFSGQVTSDPKPTRSRTIFMNPPRAASSAHGQFDARASAYSAQLWATKHRGVLSLAAIAVAGIGSALLSSRVRHVFVRTARSQRRQSRW